MSNPISKSSVATNKIIQLQEFEELSVGTHEGGLAGAEFEWLLSSASRLFALKRVDTLQALSLVGVIRLPSGRQIEIMPKISRNNSSTKKILLKMLRSVSSLGKNVDIRADLELARYSLFEWIITDFLLELRKLVRSGLFSQYERVDETLQFVRGQLRIGEMLNQPPGRRQVFPVRHDIFSLQRLENKLIKTALVQVRRLTQAPNNWKSARELEVLLDPIESCDDPINGLNRWSEEPLLKSYAQIRKLCEFVLKGFVPYSQSGLADGFSWFLPMEQLFQEYVVLQMRKQIPQDASLQRQDTTRKLLSIAGSETQSIRPDLVITKASTVHILDTKWKRINGAAIPGCIDNGDLYQMLAYGINYGVEKGSVCLVYPAHADFDKAVGPIRYNMTNVDLHILPFDLESDQLLGYNDMTSICEKMYY